MKSWHSFYHKKVNVLGPVVTQPNPPPEVFTPEEEDALITFLANGGSFMIDTTPLLYNVSTAFCTLSLQNLNFSIVICRV
jgi:hypothetical protein